MNSLPGPQGLDADGELLVPYVQHQPLWADDNRRKSNLLDWVPFAHGTHSSELLFLLLSSAHNGW